MDRQNQARNPRRKTGKERGNLKSIGVHKAETEMRINKFIANAGVCSRREADSLIIKGLIKINDKVVTEVGTKINPLKDKISYKGKELSAEKKVYILINKPKDVVTTVDDPHADKTVMDIIKDACEERLYPVGRLDRNTTGVLLLTNDGDLTKKLSHPKYNRKKIYHIFLDKKVSKVDLESMVTGIDLDDGKVAADKVSYVDDDLSQVGLEIHSGKNRVVRRMFEHMGYRVKKLDRVYFAGLTKKKLPRGKWRFLTEKEIQILKMGR